MTTLSKAPHTDWSALNRRLAATRDNGAAYRMPRGVSTDVREDRDSGAREPGGVIVLRPR